MTADIQRYYDTVNVFKCAQWLIDQGFSSHRAACVLRLQMLPKVNLQIGTQNRPISNRTLGSLTGSRSAGACGRIPWVDVLERHALTHNRIAWQEHKTPVPLMTWIDNAFLAARSPELGIEYLDAIDDDLKRTWQLCFKPSSRQILLPKGAAPF